jgi:hypothetical protein
VPNLQRYGEKQLGRRGIMVLPPLSVRVIKLALESRHVVGERSAGQHRLIE